VDHQPNNVSNTLRNISIHDLLSSTRDKGIIWLDEHGVERKSIDECPKIPELILKEEVKDSDRKVVVK